MMWWTAPAPRHRSAITWSLDERHKEGAVHGQDYHDWFGQRQAGLPGAWRRRGGWAGAEPAVAARRGAEVFRQAAGLRGRHGSVRLGSLLGARDCRAGP